MKKIISVMLAVLLSLFLLAGCANELPPSENQNDTFAHSDDNTPAAVTIKAAECFDNAGFTSFVCEKSGEYQFTASASDGVEWAVYLLDSEFEDAVRFIPQAYPTALEGNGTVNISAGTYVYVYCSVNSFTADKPDEKAAYSYLLVNGDSADVAGTENDIAPEAPVYTVKSEDSYVGYGFTSWTVPADGTYRFVSKGSDVTWNIFILDEEFEDAIRYLPQSYEPVLEAEDGVLELICGQIAYIQCSANDFTGDAVVGCSLSIYAE